MRAIRESDFGSNAGERPHEVFDHAAGLGMIHIETVKLTVADEVDTCLLLRADDNAGRVENCLLGRQDG